jgi:hypothetical protein
MAKEKIGAGALEAYFRHGLREIREATIAFPGQTPVAQESLGMPGNPTPQEVTEMRREDRQPEMEME